MTEPLATLRAQLEQLAKSRLWVNPETPLEMVLLSDVVKLVDALLRPSRPPEENFPQEQFLSTGHVGGGAGAQSDDTVAASRPPEEPQQGKPAPCPLCGGKAYATRTVTGTQMFHVGCAACGLELKAAWYREKPTKDILGLWNHRVAASREAQEPTNKSLAVMHARKQGNADGFQSGWHAALTRVMEGDSVSELCALVPQTMKQETAWLIGRVGPQWWTGRTNEWTDYVDGCVTDPARCAIRFARREDAERAIGWLLSREQREFCQPEEHIWG